MCMTLTPHLDLIALERHVTKYLVLVGGQRSAGKSCL